MSRLVVSTRPSDEAEKTLTLIKARGFDAMNEPMMVIKGIDAAWEELPPPYALVLTSARALPFIPGMIDPGVPVFAVGDATADKARARGFRNVASAGGSAVELQALLRGQSFPADAVLWHPCGADVAAEMVVPDARVLPAPVYKAHAVAEFSENFAAALGDGRVDTILFYSPRTAAIFSEIAVKYGRTEPLKAIKALCLSPSVVKSLEHLPWQAVRAARNPDQGAMLELLGYL